MKILFIDNESIQNTIRMGLMEQEAHHDIHMISDEEEAIAFYNEESPDIVLIDFTIPHGLDILYRLLEINPFQDIISISDKLDCCEYLGCTYCLENYNKKRVLKKQGIHDLLYLIENFEGMPCEHAHKLPLPSVEDESIDKGLPEDEG